MSKKVSTMSTAPAMLIETRDVMVKSGQCFTYLEGVAERKLMDTEGSRVSTVRCRKLQRAAERSDEGGLYAVDVELSTANARE